MDSQGQMHTHIQISDSVTHFPRQEAKQTDDSDNVIFVGFRPLVSDIQQRRDTIALCERIRYHTRI